MNNKKQQKKTKSRHRKNNKEIKCKTNITPNLL